MLFRSLFGSGLGGFNTTAVGTLTSNGVEVGDLMFDNNNTIMYYVSSKNPLSAVPDVSGLGRFNLLSRVSGDNGITSLAVPAELITTRLNTNYFTVNNSVGIRLLRETTVDNQLTVNSDIIGNAGFTLGGSKIGRAHV